MDHTVLPANYTMPAFCFASVHQMAPLLSEVEGIWWGLTTHLSTSRDERLSWRGWLTFFRMVTHRLHVERRTGKFAGEKTDVLPLFHAINRDSYLSGNPKRLMD